MRKTPLLIFLLCISLHTEVGADEPANLSVRSEQSAVSLGGAVTRSIQQNEGPVAEPSSTSTGAFDFSFYLVAGIGFAGLMWMRHQAQSI